MPIRDAKSVISIAKGYVSDVFGEEGAFNVGLEEINFDSKANSWRVTIGFSRPWDRPTFQNALVPQAQGRSYKVVEIADLSGDVVGVTTRSIQNAA